MKIYFISGLGADQEVFRHIELPQGFDVVHLHWICPLPQEGLSEYALRLATSINTKEPFGVLGLSMGGMMATEISKYHDAAVTILISTIPLSTQLPPWYRWFGYIKMHRWTPIRFFQNASFIKRFFTTETKEDKDLIRHMIRRVDTGFIRWCLGAILDWRNSILPKSYIHIHGTRDELLPIILTRPSHKIKGAGHLMVMNRASEINSIIASHLKSF